MKAIGLFAFWLLAAPSHAQLASPEMGPAQCAGVFCDCDPNHIRPCGFDCVSYCSGHSGSGDSGAASAGPPAGFSPSQQMMVQGAYAAGQAIGDMIRQSAEQARQRTLLEQQRQAALAEQARQRELERRRLFQEHKQTLLDEMGGDSGRLTMKDDDDSAAADGAARQRWVDEMCRAEMDQRSRSLAQVAPADRTWCKLNLIHTRCPTRPVNDVAGQYPQMVERYIGWKRRWDRRCGGPSAQEGYRGFDEEFRAVAGGPQPGRGISDVPEAGPSSSGPLGFKDDPPSSLPEPATPAAQTPSEPPRTVAPLLSSQPAPDFPSSWGTPAEVRGMLASDAPAVAPDAYDFLSRAGRYLGERSSEESQGMIRQAIEGGTGGFEGTILYNESKLPEYVLPKVLAAARGDLTPGEADSLTAGAANVLYNVGALPNEVVAHIAEKGSASEGISSWAAGKVQEAQSAVQTAAQKAVGQGIASLVSEKAADMEYGADARTSQGAGGRFSNILYQASVTGNRRSLDQAAHEVPKLADEWTKAARAILGGDDEP